MKTSEQAELIVIEYYKKKGIELFKAKRGDIGFDLKDKMENLFIEVKGSANESIPFRYFTNSEYEKARTCRRNKLKYEIHLVTGIGEKLVKHYIIPERILYPAIATVVLYKMFGIWDFRALLSLLTSAILAGAFFLLIVLVSKGKWMGMGDVKMAFFMGLFLGFPNILVALFSAFFFGAIIGTGLVISNKKSLKSEVPFGPFLVVGTLMAMFWGQDIINWYLGLLN